MKHLLPEERHTIQKMKQQGHTQKDIAVELGRSLIDLTRSQTGLTCSRTELTDHHESLGHY
jgi:hypothetical protein